MANSSGHNDIRREILKELTQTSSIRHLFEDSSSDTEEENETAHECQRVKNYTEETVANYSDAEFKSNFRLEKSSFDTLMAFFEPFMMASTSTFARGRTMVPAKKQVLMTIYYLANQDSFRQVSNLFDVSKSTAHSIINRVVDLLYTHSPKFIYWPTKEEAAVNEQMFFNKCRMRNILGCIDGSHITILNLESDSDFVNRKGYSSILLQGVINYKMEFIDIYCGEPGSMHDARLLRKSGLFRKMEEDPSHMYGYFILGDSAYMSKDWLVPPFKDNGRLTDQERQFNYIHSSVRVRVENALGMLKGRFRRLREFQNVTRTFIIRATVASVVLHNICIRQNDNIDIATESETQRIEEYPESEDIASTPCTNRRQQAFLQLFSNSN